MFITGSIGQAALMCSSLFNKSYDQKRNFKIMSHVAGQHEDFIQYLNENKGQLRLLDIEARLKKLTHVYENYLTDSGIKFEKIDRFINMDDYLLQSSLQNGERLQYSLYSLTGTFFGNETSKMIYGLQSNPKINTHTLTINLDILAEIKNPDVFGTFDPKTKSINISAKALLYDQIKLWTVLRHEIQHYFEYVKLLTGQPTLARFKFRNTEGEKDFLYSRLMSLDEVEAHLRDLRSLSNESIHSANEIKLLDLGYSQEMLGHLERQRKIEIKNDLATLNQFVNHARPIILDVQQQIKNTNFAGSDFFIAEQYVLIKLQNKAYSNLEINLSGLIPKNENLTNEQLKQIIVQQLHWVEKRLQDVENEMMMIASHAK